MLSKYMVNSLQDLALEQLPGTKALSKKLYIEHGNSRAALQAVAWAPTLLINSPLSTSLEVLAGRLLALVNQHPCTHTEYLIEKMDGDDGLCISVENAVLWAEQDRPYIEEALLETARQLCEISGANLPPWMDAIDGQFAQQQSTATPAPVVAVIRHSTKARRDTLTPVIELAQTKCLNPKDAAAVWAALLVLAENKNDPLRGATEDGLQYLKGGEAAIFKRKSLGQRLAR